MFEVVLEQTCPQIYLILFCQIRFPCLMHLSQISSNIWYFIRKFIKLSIHLVWWKCLMHLRRKVLKGCLSDIPVGKLHMYFIKSKIKW